MSYDHDLMAHRVSTQLLDEIRASRAPWSNGELGPRTALWQGLADWPRPDIALQDTTRGVSLAFEFKPPNQPKREYVTGLGQALTYLNDFTYSGLILPARAYDGFPISDYIADMLERILPTQPIALLEYSVDPHELRTRRRLQVRVGNPVGIPSGTGRKVFWGYWRDLSNHEVLEFLRLLEAQKRPSFKRAFDRYWSRFATRGLALTWEGKARKRKLPQAPGKNAERINAHLAMRHAGLLDRNDRLTADGYRLLQTGEIYGPQSTAFVETLAGQVLIPGRHLELIFWIEEQRWLIPPRSRSSAKRWHRALDLRLEGAGVIEAPPRGAAKSSFLRDEPKLWRKLGLLMTSPGGVYFRPGVGYVFDWRKILSAIETRA